MNDVLEKAFSLYVQGYPLRNLSKRFSIPKSTLAFRFKKKYGDNYSKLRNSQGLMSVIREYIRSPHLSQQERTYIQSWMYSNIAHITDSDIKNHHNPLLSDAQLNKLTIQQCSHSDKDWRDLFQTIFSN